MDYSLIICLVSSFIVTFMLTLWWIPKAKGMNIVGIDINKLNKKKITEMGGLSIIGGFVFGMFLYIGHLTFIQGDTSFNMMILGTISTILLISIIGILDDILGWKVGIRQIHKPFLIALCALPMMMINSGNPGMSLPIIGYIDLGVIYPLLIIPLAISCSSNAFNMLAGINGLETKQGILIISYLSFVIWLQQGLSRVAMIGFAFTASLAAFYYFNKYPSKIFPGNLMTFTTGAMIGILAILGNTQKLALFLFIPYFLEFILKLRGGFRKQSYLKPTAKTLKCPYKNSYSLTHLSCRLLSMFRLKVTERRIVLLINLFQASLIILSVPMLF